MSESVSRAGDGNFDPIGSGSALFLKPMKSTGRTAMSSWQLIFKQSRVNNGSYDGDRLPAQNWHWPRGTWFQARLRKLRRGNTYNEFSQ